MKNCVKYRTRDYQIAGAPFRILYDRELPQPLFGDDVIEKAEDMRRNYDNVRAVLMREPRGHAGMMGAVLSKPTHGADWDVVFMDVNGYPAMCGHGSMALAYELFKKRSIKINTLAGRVVVSMTKDSVMFVNVPCFVQTNLYDGHVVFGGDFFYVIDAKAFNMSFKRTPVEEIVAKALSVFKDVKDHPIEPHPHRPWIDHIDALMVYERIDRATFRSAVVAGGGYYDRAPCGTGTSCLVTLAYNKGWTTDNDEIENIGIADTAFIGGSHRTGIIGGDLHPIIYGKGNLMGDNTWIVEKGDFTHLGLI